MRLLSTTISRCYNIVRLGVNTRQRRLERGLLRDARIVAKMVELSFGDGKDLEGKSHVVQILPMAFNTTQHINDGLYLPAGATKSLKREITQKNKAELYQKQLQDSALHLTLIWILLIHMKRNTQWGKQRSMHCRSAYNFPSRWAKQNQFMRLVVVLC